MSVKAILTEQQKSYTKAEEDALLSDYYNKDYIDTYMAPLDTPTFVGQPKAPTAAAGTNTTQIATTAFVEQAKTTRVPVYGLGKNLLDNWYFGNPVNQRGQSNYSSAGYGLDRWYVDSNSRLDIVSGGIQLGYTSGSLANIYQTLEKPALLLGKKLTLTILDSNGVHTGSGTVSSSFPSSLTTIINITDTNVVYRLRISSSSIQFVWIEYTSTSSATKRTVYAVKLELGTEQTLAHLESSTWVLNEIPDYEYELYRCITSTADSNDAYANKTLATTEAFAPTMQSVSPNTSAGVTVAYGGYWTIGKMVIVNIRLDCSQALSSNAVLATGLPNYSPHANWIATANNHHIDIPLGYNGSIFLAGGVSLAANSVVIIHVVYISE